jgi:hypothetical protein
MIADDARQFIFVPYSRLKSSVTEMLFFGMQDECSAIVDRCVAV